MATQTYCVTRCGDEYTYDSAKNAIRQYLHLFRVFGNPSCPETAIRIYEGDRELTCQESDRLAASLYDA